MQLITAWFTCRPGMRDEFLAVMRQPSAETRLEAGCVFFEYHPHADDPDTVILIEGFRDAAAHEFHRHTAHMAVMQAELRRLVARVHLCQGLAANARWVDLDFIANPPGPWKP